MLCGAVEGFPPFGLFFQVAIEPGEDGLHPEAAAMIFIDTVISLVAQDHFNGPFEQSESGIHLVAFKRRNVSICGTVE